MYKTKYACPDTKIAFLEILKEILPDDELLTEEDLYEMGRVIERALDRKKEALLKDREDIIRDIGETLGIDLLELLKNT